MMEYKNKILRKILNSIIGDYTHGVSVVIPETNKIDIYKPLHSVVELENIPMFIIYRNGEHWEALEVDEETKQQVLDTRI